MKQCCSERSIARIFNLYGIVWAAFMSGSGQIATAATFCVDLEQFDPAIDHAMPRPHSSGPETDAICGNTQTLSGNISSHCSWSFPYRSVSAHAFFEAMVQEVTACKAAAERSKENPVNHPDSYDLRRFEISGNTISISLKDKGALQQTVVFLRVERRE